MLSKPAAVALVKDQLLPAYRAERARLDRIDAWYRWKQELPNPPRGATAELKRLLDLSRTPWLGLVVTTVAQAMFVDGYRSPEVGENAGPWRTWNANDFDTRQTAVHRGALAYGYSFVKVTPGTDAEGKRSVMRGVSPRKMYAVYQDPAADDWPMFALEVARSGKDYALSLWDDEQVYRLSASETWDDVTFIQPEAHDAGECPFVRYANMLDLDGRADGEVDPFIGVASRINKTLYDRLLVQHFNSWKKITISGLAEFADSEEQANRQKLKLRQDDILVAEDPETKFGVLDETGLDGFVNAWESDIEALAAVSQTPSYALTGKMVNLAAEALAAARGPLTQKVAERQSSFGKSHAQALRMAAHLEGDDGAAADVMARVTWQDMEIRSMAQAADALGKFATMLGVPVQALWSRIPGVTKSDVDDWKVLAAEGDAFANLGALLDRQAEQPAPPAA